eukprot:TRINITY_DN47235_c0_g1_i1.p1 TRINITY_DN47235_c0_g1~~TRINITY_DN47235_c0_g1_i1.p1  ORF type:complete len:488 (+),score=68.50 TRINITY_DN47235_c0_g1_i1:76-1539(+)
MRTTVRRVTEKAAPRHRRRAGTAPWQQQASPSAARWSGAADARSCFLLTGVLGNTASVGWARVTPDDGGGRSLPFDVFGKRYIDASAGCDHFAAVTDDGMCVIVGGNGRGQAGRRGGQGFGAAAVPSFVQQIDDSACCRVAGFTFDSVAASERPDAVECGLRQTAVWRRGTRRAWVCGANTFGELGVGHTDEMDNRGDGRDGLPGSLWTGVNAIDPDDGGIVDWSSRYSHSLVLTESGSVYSFGVSLDGALGHGNSLNVRTPKRVQFFHKRGLKVTRVHAGNCCSFFTTSDNTLWSCGKLDGGRCGLPMPGCGFGVALLPREVTAGADALTAEEVRVCVARNAQGSFSVHESGGSGAGLPAAHKESQDLARQVYRRGFADVRTSPNQWTLVHSGEQNVVQAASGFQHSVFATTTGSVWGHGDTSEGQLGAGASAMQPTNLLSPWAGSVRVAAGGACTVLVLTRENTAGAGFPQSAVAARPLRIPVHA